MELSLCAHQTHTHFQSATVLVSTPKAFSVPLSPDKCPSQRSNTYRSVSENGSLCWTAKLEYHTAPPPNQSSSSGTLQTAQGISKFGQHNR